MHMLTLCVLLCLLLHRIYCEQHDEHTDDNSNILAENPLKKVDNDSLHT